MLDPSVEIDCVQINHGSSASRLMDVLQHLAHL